MQNTLASLINSASSQVVSAIKGAAGAAGVDFSYLLQQAKVESSFDPNAKAKTSSAAGLFQFIESTWMDMVKRHGPAHGLSEQAAKIDANGRVNDPQMRRDILNLRYNPEIASKMAAEFANDNQGVLKSRWGGEIGSTELYMAHFLGAGSASAFLKARDENPMQDAALLFPSAAKANPNVFYDKTTGRAKSLEEVYANFDAKFSIESDFSPAQNTQQPSRPRGASQIFTANQSPASMFRGANTGPLFMGSSGASPVQGFNFANLLHSPVELMMMAHLDLDLPFGNEDDKHHL